MSRREQRFQVIVRLEKFRCEPTWNEISEYSPEVKCYWNRWDSVVVYNGLLCYIYKHEGNSDYLPIIPRPLVESVLYQLHNTPTSGHLGVKKTQENVRKRFYWKGMSSDVERWIKACEICGSKKGPRKKIRAPMKFYVVGAPMERIAMDILGPFAVTEKGNKYILVICDYFTKWVEAIPIPNQVHWLKLL